MENDEQPELFRLPETPFEVALLIKRIFCNLGDADLQNCCLVSRSWNDAALKLLQQLRVAFRRVQCRLVPSEETLQRALRNEEKLFLMENDQQLLDLLRTRNLPGSHDSLPPFRFEYEPPSFIADRENSPRSPLYRFGLNQDFSAFFSASYDRTITTFLTNPLLSDFVGSVTLNRRFADLEAVLAILTKLPNLKDLKLKFEVQTCRLILGPAWVFNLSEAATSSVKKLELNFVRNLMETSTEIMGQPLEQEIKKYISAILKVCRDLETFKLVDSGCGIVHTPFNIEYFESLKRPEILKELEIHSMNLEIRQLRNIPERIHLLNVLSNLKSLDLRNWGRLPLADWNRIATNSDLLPNLESLRLCLRHTECPQQLLGNKFVELNQRSTLILLDLELTWEETHPFEHFRWREEWNVVQGGEPLTLTKAMLFSDETGSFVDLKAFKNLRNLSLVSSEKGLQVEEDRRFSMKPGRPMLDLTWQQSQQEQDDGQNRTQEISLTLTDASIYLLAVDWPIDLKTAFWNQHVTLRVRKRALAAALAAAPSCVNHLEITLPKDDFIFTLSENEEKSKAGEYYEVSGAVDAAQLEQFCSRCRLQECVVNCVYSKEKKKLNQLVKTLDPQTASAGQTFWRAMESASEDSYEPCCEFALVLGASAGVAENSVAQL